MMIIQDKYKQQTVIQLTEYHRSNILNTTVRIYSTPPFEYTQKGIGRAMKKYTLLYLPSNTPSWK